MSAITLFLLSSAFVAALTLPPGVNINAQVDKCLAEFRAKARATGSTSMSLRDFKVDPVEGKGVTVSDLTTIRRIGDAFAWVEGTKYRFSLRVGWDNFVEDVKELTFNGETMHAWFKMGENRMLWEFTVNKTPGECTTSWDKYEWEVMDKVTMYSDNPNYNEIDVSDIFKDLVMPYVNQVQGTSEFKEYLQKEMDFCPYVKMFV